MVTCVVMMVAVTASPAPGAEPEPRAAGFLGPDVLVSGPGADTDEEHLAVAHNSTDHEYLVVWLDGRDGDQTIYGRRLAADGTPIGAEIRISALCSAGADDHPAVAYDSLLDRYLVVWQDRRNGDGDIYGQKVGADGSLVGPNLQISPPGTTREEAYPDVAFNPIGGQFLVVWQSSTGSEPSWEILAQRVKASGKRAGEAFRVGPDEACSGEQPAVAHDPVADRYLVVWNDDRDRDTRSWDLYGRRIKPSGAFAGAEFRISDDAAVEHAINADIAVNPARSQYLVVWDDGRAVMEEIWGQRIRSGGRLGGSNYRVSSDATRRAVMAGIDYNAATDRYLLVWSDYRDDPSRGRDVYGRRIKSGGRLQGDEFRISGWAARGDERWPVVAADPAQGTFLVGWSDGRDENTRDLDAYVRGVTG